ncbi:hypothetical protein ES707_12163 [subsurface metagenome]
MKRFLVLVMASILAIWPIASCGGDEATPFSLQVIPAYMEDTIAGQSCVFLVTVTDEGEGGGQGVNISATAPGAEVTVSPQAITPGQVAEVIVVPDEASISSTLTVTVNGERDGLKQTETVTLDVLEDIYDSEGLATYAIELHDKFIPWLAENHPELGITSQTEWTGTIVTPHIMVVMYYLFFSEDWEMGLRWHVTIPPYDWAEIYLRHRTIEVAPSYAFKISSLEAQDEPQAVEPEASVWR